MTETLHALKINNSWHSNNHEKNQSRMRLWKHCGNNQHDVLTSENSCTIIKHRNNSQTSYITGITWVFIEFRQYITIFIYTCMWVLGFLRYSKRLTSNSNFNKSITLVQGSGNRDISTSHPQATIKNVQKYCFGNIGLL